MVLPVWTLYREKQRKYPVVLTCDEIAHIADLLERSHTSGPISNYLKEVFVNLAETARLLEPVDG